MVLRHFNFKEVMKILDLLYGKATFELEVVKLIGIYKITNKLNGKSYIGQSIHYGKRLDEHYAGSK